MDCKFHELNSMFSRTTENVELQSPSLFANTPSDSSFNQSIFANRSSSSADSISPESYPSTSACNIISEFNYNNETSAYQGFIDTPQRRRPIVGRNIMGRKELIPNYESLLLSPFGTSQEFELMTNTNDPFLVQKSYPISIGNKIADEQKSNSDIFYQLFPSEPQSNEFKSPVKTVSPVSSNWTSPVNMSTPTRCMSQSSIYNWSSNSDDCSRSPNLQFPTPYVTHRNLQTNYIPNDTNVGATRWQNIHETLNAVPHGGISQHGNFNKNANYEEKYSKLPMTKFCSFCRKNGETPLVYNAHPLKIRNVVLCPILRSLVCQICNASGDNAHTITYCPVLRSRNNGRPLQSTTITLKNTRIKSSGRKRY